MKSANDVGEAGDTAVQIPSFQIGTVASTIVDVAQSLCCSEFMLLVIKFFLSFLSLLVFLSTRQYSTMVSTRSQTQDSPRHAHSQDLTPSKTKSRISPEQELIPSKPKAIRRRKGPWAHTPSNLSILWLAVSLPLVAWDTGYVMLRPHSMPGGSLHWPLWVPYELYGRVDYIYGWKAFNEKNGFTAAQGLLNFVETSMYLYYLYILFAYGRPSTAQGRGAPKTAKVGVLGQQRYVDGQMGALAVLVGFSAAIMTVSKTVLYCKCWELNVLPILTHRRGI